MGGLAILTIKTSNKTLTVQYPERIYNKTSVTAQKAYKQIHIHMAVLCLVPQSRLSLCDPMDCSPPGSSVHGDSPGKNTGVGSHALLQGIFPTQGLNPGLLHCWQVHYYLSHQGSPWILEWVACSFSRGSSWLGNWTRISCIAGRFFTRWVTREAPYTHDTGFNKTGTAEHEER